MAKKKAAPAPERTPDEIAAEHAAKLPPSRRARLQAADDALRVFDDSIRLDNAHGAQMMGEIYSAVVWLLNGRTFDGASADDDSAGNVVMAACAATPGEVPGWGRAGSFLLEVDQLRVRVEVEPWGCGLEQIIAVGFHAVDLAAPFISATGYRSDFVRASTYMGRSLPQVLAGIVRDYKRVTIDPEQIDVMVTRVPAWLSDLPSLGDAPCYDADGQMMMGFSLQAEPKAPKTAAERQADLRRRRKAAQQAGELVILELSAEEAEFIGGAVCSYARENERRPEVQDAADSLWRRVRIARSGGRYSPTDPKWSREAVQADLKAVREKLAALWEGGQAPTAPASDALQLDAIERDWLRRGLDLLNEHQSPEGEPAARQLALLRKLVPGADWLPDNQRVMATIHSNAQCAARHAQGQQRRAETAQRKAEARADAAERMLRALGSVQVEGEWQGVEQLHESMAATLKDHGPVIALLEAAERIRGIAKQTLAAEDRGRECWKEALQLRARVAELEQQAAAPAPAALTQDDQSYLWWAVNIAEALRDDNADLAPIRERQARLFAGSWQLEQYGLDALGDELAVSGHVGFLQKEVERAFAVANALREQMAAAKARHEREESLLINERTEAYAAAERYKGRLQAAGLSTDYRRQPGE